MRLTGWDAWSSWAVGLVLVLGLAVSQPTVAQSSDEQTMAELRELATAYEEGLSNDQLDRLMPYLHPAFSGTMITGEHVEGSEDVRAYWRRIKDLIGDGGAYRVAVEPRDASLLADDVAVAHGTTDEHVKTGMGQTFDFSGEWLALLEKEDDGWKIRNVHASMDPLNNPFVKEARRGQGWLMLAVGLAGGLLIGVLGTWLWQRRRQRKAG